MRSMTNNDIRKARKAIIYKKLREFQEKITYHTKLLKEASTLHKNMQLEYETLDRKIFEYESNITIVKPKKDPSEISVSNAQISVKKKIKILDTYEKMSTAKQQLALDRLLKIQAAMRQKI